jgi:hypothetical protein
VGARGSAAFRAPLAGWAGLSGAAACQHRSGTGPETPQRTSDSACHHEGSSPLQLTPVKWRPPSALRQSARSGSWRGGFDDARRRRIDTDSSIADSASPRSGRQRQDRPTGCSAAPRAGSPRGLLPEALARLPAPPPGVRWVGWFRKKLALACEHRSGSASRAARSHSLGRWSRDPRVTSASYARRPRRSRPFSRSPSSAAQRRSGASSGSSPRRSPSSVASPTSSLPPSPGLAWRTRAPPLHALRCAGPYAKGDLSSVGGSPSGSHAPDRLRTPSPSK